MRRGLSVDYGSVLVAARSLAVMGRRLAGAPGGRGLRRVAAGLPGGRLAGAATGEADEWRLEVDEVTAGLTRYDTAVRAAVGTYRAVDRGLAR